MGTVCVGVGEGIGGVNAALSAMGGEFNALSGVDIWEEGQHSGKW